MKNIQIVSAAAIVAALVGGYGLYWLGEKHAMVAMPGGASASPQANSGTRAGLKAGEVDPATGRRILYYHDPMVPAQKFDHPGKSPFMDMMLVPVYAGGDDDAGTVSVSPRIQQNLGLRTAEVVEGTLSSQVTAVGSIAFDEREQAVVQARATGFVERLQVRATLDRVRKGQPLADLYVPDWVAAQEEFLAVRRMHGADLAPLVDGARQRMRQAGMSDEQIRLVESSGRVQARVALTSPVDGVVAELPVREGMTVMAGTTLFRLSGLGRVWADAAVPESQAALLRPGTAVRATSPALPGSTFEGKVQAILPEVDAATRTLKARMELANPGARLVPGMFVTMQFADTHAAKALTVPSDAVIQTGQRSLVMLAQGDGHFRPAEVKTGLESNGQTQILGGLQAGQKVVASAQFLVDSEASLRGLEARLADSAAPSPAMAASMPMAAAAVHHGEGKVEAMDAGMITLSHGPIASMGWGAMTMGFRLPKAGPPPGIKAGDRVTFDFVMADDGPRITAIAAAASAGGRP